MRGIFIYLFLKSLTSEIDLYITLYTEQKSKHNRGNYSSMGKGCSPRPMKLIFLFDKDVFFPSTVEHWKYTGKFSLWVNLFIGVYVQRFASFLSKQLSSQYVVPIFPMWLKHLCNSDLSGRVWSWLPSHIVKSKLDQIISCLSNTFESKLLYKPLSK